MDPHNQPQVYIALQHQNSITYWQMQTYPGQTDPPNWPQVYIGLLHNSIIYGHMQIYPGQTDPHLPPLIDPKCTEPYYTKTVLLSDKGTLTTQLTPSVYSPTTPKLYYLLTNADIPRGHESIDEYRGTQCGNNLSQVRNGKGWCVM